MCDQATERSGFHPRRSRNGAYKRLVLTSPGPGLLPGIGEVSALQASQRALPATGLRRLCKTGEQTADAGNLMALRASAPRQIERAA
jgi:hypothetical protein